MGFYRLGSNMAKKKAKSEEFEKEAVEQVAEERSPLDLTLGNHTVEGLDSDVKEIKENIIVTETTICSAPIDPSPQLFELSHLAELLKAEYQYVCDNFPEADVYEYKHKLIEMFPAAAKDLFPSSDQILIKIKKILEFGSAQKAQDYYNIQLEINTDEVHSVCFDCARIFDQFGETLDI